MIRDGWLKALGVLTPKALIPVAEGFHKVLRGMLVTFEEVTRAAGLK